MIRIRLGSPLRRSDMTRLEKAVTTVTDTAITNAGFSFAVTASEEQIPSICTMTGLFRFNGPHSNLKFFEENMDALSLLMVFNCYIG